MAVTLEVSVDVTVPPWPDIVGRGALGVDELLGVPVGFLEKLGVGEAKGVELLNPGVSVGDKDGSAVAVGARTVEVTLLVRVGSLPVGEEVPEGVGSKGVLVPFDGLGWDDSVPLEVLDTNGVPVPPRAREGVGVGDREGEGVSEKDTVDVVVPTEV